MFLSSSFSIIIYNCQCWLYSVQVLVVANPANTNALILKENAPSIPAENITCLTRLDHNRALGQVQPPGTLLQRYLCCKTLLLVSCRYVATDTALRLHCP